MIEIPEAAVLAKQINATIASKTIRKAAAAHSPHGFAWYSGDPASYPAMLEGKCVGQAVNHGGMVEIAVEDVTLLFGDGVNLRFHQPHEAPPAKHQLLINFEDSSALSASVAMYGGLWCYPQGSNENPYYLAALEKPSPLGSDFSLDHFLGLFSTGQEKLSIKALLATQQRIPGLGNGVLQDILFNAGLQPALKISLLSAQEKQALYAAIKSTLLDMAEHGGRDTEKDLVGAAGRYVTIMSKNTAGSSCPRCGQFIQKQTYLGGSVYFCQDCQRGN